MRHFSVKYVSFLNRLTITSNSKIVARGVHPTLAYRILEYEPPFAISVNSLEFEYVWSTQQLEHMFSRFKWRKISSF